MLEIGLGCDMNYGPGASVKLWKTLFPKAQLWEAENDAKCVAKHMDSALEVVNVLLGDQGNYGVLDSWVEKSGGNFYVVIEDGDHKQGQFWNSPNKLWPVVKPGGLLFLSRTYGLQNIKFSMEGLMSLKNVPRVQMRWINEGVH